MGKPFEPKCLDRNLLKVFDELNLKCFNGMVYGGIGWRKLPVRSAATYTLAECQLLERFIGVNTLLTDRRIPMWFVRFIVYHEMLHLLLGEKPDGYGGCHNARYMLAESRYSEYKKSVDFEADTLPHIIETWVALRRYSSKKS